MTRPRHPLLALTLLLGFGVAQVARGQGQFVGWGQDFYNDVGQASPTLPSLLRYRQIEAGYSYSVALRQDGSVAAWGRNEFKQCDVPAATEPSCRSATE